MSFNFGPVNFNNPTSTPGFGLGTQTAPKPATTGFGSTSFGFTTSTPAAGTSGFGLGANPAFGTPSFGTPAAAPGFGAAAPNNNTMTAGGFGTSGFGQTPATTTSTGFNFGTGSFAQPAPAATAASSIFNFGQYTAGQQQTTAPAQTGFAGFGGFGKPAATTATTGFSGFGTGLGTSLGNTTLGGTGFGSTLGATNTGFGLGTGMQLQQQQQQLQLQQQQQQPNQNEAVFNSMFNCNVYGDERDVIISRWNMIQALWGVGKGYYAQNMPPVEYTQQNPWCRFKSIGYSCFPTSDNKDGLVSINFNKKETELRSGQANIQYALNQILGNKPSLAIAIESIKPVSDTRSQLIITVTERTVTGGLRKVPSNELEQYLLQPMQKQQLANIAVDNVYSQISPDSEQFKEYLENPPAGIDVRLWKQAQLDNPNPEKYIPVPIVGFEEIRWRMRCQEQETQIHQAFLDRVSGNIAELQRRHSATLAKITEYRQKFVELEHRVLQVVVKQEISRKVGLALQPGEESLRGQLEALQAHLASPNQFKSRLSELIARIRLQKRNYAPRDVERYSMDPNVQVDLKQFLRMEQSGMSFLMETIQSDLKNLKIIKDGMNLLVQEQ